MSTDADELLPVQQVQGPESRVPGRTLADAHSARIASSVGFIGLLILALLWPAPVLWVNDATFDAALGIDQRSFLGREAPEWDVVFWGIAGLFVLALLHGRIDRARASLKLFAADLISIRSSVVRRLRQLRMPHVLLIIAVAALVPLMWIWLDALLIARAELLQDDRVLRLVTLANRLGGGMNPTMIIIFFAFAGLIFAHRLWMRFAVAMTLTGIAGGIIGNLLKVIVSRSRPELWLGPFDHSGPAASSFPSGHTVSAFAIASVLFFGAKSPVLRLASIVLAFCVAGSRVIAFRHWPSDVLASAVICMILGWFFITAIDRPASNVPRPASEGSDAGRETRDARPMHD